VGVEVVGDAAHHGVDPKTIKVKKNGGVWLHNQDPFSAT
jgi:hypothetical protein